VLPVALVAVGVAIVAGALVWLRRRRAPLAVEEV
jgi:LPXTG-motif cell wall-anchored protein